MALVQVEDRRLEAEPAEHAHAADAEHELLAEPVLAVAAVERVGDVARPVGVALDLRVEEVERHAADLRAPDAEPDGHELPVASASSTTGAIGTSVSGSRLVSMRGIALDLAVVLVEPLAEVAAAVEEADADERDAELGGRLQVVAGEDAEPARVDRAGSRRARTRRRSTRRGGRRPSCVLSHHVTLSRSASSRSCTRPSRTAYSGVSARSRSSSVSSVRSAVGLCPSAAKRAGASAVEEGARARRPGEREVARDRVERRAQRRSVVDIRP